MKKVAQHAHFKTLREKKMEYALKLHRMVWIKQAMSMKRGKKYIHGVKALKYVPASHWSENSEDTIWVPKICILAFNSVWKA